MSSGEGKMIGTEMQEASQLTDLGLTGSIELT